MMAMQEETQLLYQKYGISPMGSCVQMLIQMPILFALYRVFYNIPAYLSGVKGSFTGLVDSIQQTSGYQDTLVSLMEKYNVVTIISLISFISFLQRAGMLFWTVNFLMVFRAQLRRRTMRYFISTTFWD